MAIARKPAKRINDEIPAADAAPVADQPAIRKLRQAPIPPSPEKERKKTASFSIPGLRSLGFIGKKLPLFAIPAKMAGNRSGKDARLPVAEPERTPISQAAVVSQPAVVEPVVLSVEETAQLAQQHAVAGIRPAPVQQPSLPIEEKTAREAPSDRASAQEKAGYISPSYTMSRRVTLNPQVMVANRCVGFQHDSPELEYYRVLRTRILQRSNGGGNTVMVTSALPGEGKTLTAINLAFTFAKEFRQTALLVDCDLRRQQVHKILGFPSEKGVADYLLDGCPVRDLFVWPGVEKLSVISGGKTILDSSELLGSPGMRDLVVEMKNRYPERFVFFDVPPLLTCADPLAFAPFVDYIVVAVHAGRTPLPDVSRALGLLPSEKVLGLVLNRHKDVVKPYGYGERSGKRAEG